MNVTEALAKKAYETSLRKCQETSPEWNVWSRHELHVWEAQSQAHKEHWRAVVKEVLRESVRLAQLEKPVATYQLDDVVYHDVYGIGHVIECYSLLQEGRLLIMFPSVGQKIFLASKVKLRVLAPARVPRTPDTTEG